MSISQEKKDFIKKTAPGIHVYMATSYTADEIAKNAEEPIEEYIKDNILSYEKSAIGSMRYWFSENKFCKAVDTLDDDKLRELLLYLDNIDMCLCDVFAEASIDAENLDDNEKIYANVITFEEFLDKY